MKHVKGYFPLPKRGELFSPKNVITFTGNSYIRKDGHLVMGAGAAKSVRNWCPEVGLLLGKKIPHLQEYNLASAKVNYSGRQIPIGVFQVKYHFQDSADLDLIKRSAQKLKEIVDPQVFFCLKLVVQSNHLGHLCLILIKHKDLLYSIIALLNGCLHILYTIFCK